MSSIGDLVAHLTVNTAGFQQGFAKAQTIASRGVSSVTSAIAPLVGALAGIWGAKSSIDAFKQDLAAQQKLASVLKATGQAAGISAQEIAAFASELQSVTNYGDEVTLSAAAVLASFRNIKGDIFKDAITAAQDMSSVMGTDLQGSVVQLGKALNDPTAGITALTRVGVTFTDQQKQQIRALQQSGDLLGAQQIVLSELQSEFGGAAQAMADPWKQLWNALGDVGEVIGSLIVPSLDVASSAIVGLTGNVTGAADWFKNLGIEAAVTLSHIGELTTLAATQWELFFVQVAAEAAHLFTAGLPEYAKWFFDNWFNLLVDFGNIHMTVISNLFENMKTAWQAVLDYISGNPVEFDFKPLTEGFKSSLSDLPQIPDRVVGAFEKSLQSDIDAMTKHIGDSMNTQRDELSKRFNPLENANPFALPEQTQSTAKDTATKKVGALQKGSQEATSAILAAVNGSNVQEKQLKVEEEQLTLMERMADGIASLERSAFNGGGLSVGVV